MRCIVYVADYTDDACLGEIDLDYNKCIAEGRLIRICPKKLEAKDLLCQHYQPIYQQNKFA